MGYRVVRVCPACPRSWKPFVAAEVLLNKCSSAQYYGRLVRPLITSNVGHSTMHGSCICIWQVDVFGVSSEMQRHMHRMLSKPRAHCCILDGSNSILRLVGWVSLWHTKSPLRMHMITGSHMHVPKCDRRAYIHAHMHPTRKIAIGDKKLKQDGRTEPSWSRSTGTYEQELQQKFI